MKLFKFFAVAAFVSCVAFAQDKIGYLNMNTLFEAFYKTVNANIVFEQKKLEVEDKISVLRTGVEDLVREIKKLEDDIKNELLAENVRQEAAQKYRTRLEIFQQKRDEFEKERQLSIQELRRIQLDTEDSLIKELTQLVKNYASANAYTHIIDVSGQSMNRIPVYLVYPEKQDITAAVIEVANKGHEKELEEAERNYENTRDAVLKYIRKNR